jgi:hypothetical protein
MENQIHIAFMIRSPWGIEACPELVEGGERAKREF